MKLTMNTWGLKSWFLLLCVLAATALASPYGRFLENYSDDQNTRGLFRDEAFVLSKRDKPTPNSVARLAKMHATVGIGKRDSHDMFFEQLSKLGETTARDGDWEQTSSGQSSKVNVANIDTFTTNVSELFEVLRTCPHAVHYISDSNGSWETSQLKDLLNMCLNVAVLARQMSNFS